MRTLQLTSSPLVGRSCCCSIVNHTDLNLRFKFKINSKYNVHVLKFSPWLREARPRWCRSARTSRRSRFRCRQWCGRRAGPGAIHSFCSIRDLGFWRLGASLIIFRIWIVFIPYFPPKNTSLVCFLPYFPQDYIIIFRILIVFIPNFLGNSNSHSL